MLSSETPPLEPRDEASTGVLVSAGVCGHSPRSAGNLNNWTRLSVACLVIVWVAVPPGRRAAEGSLLPCTSAQRLAKELL